uniref:AlNc14C373G11137 protein n=1 Tax=Albugo laibachii Nc14 TaxID=890382 RepID=F0WY77_9STRA|nr:AlNc14C373G11137 [Albugo laibachii Nc14]|eukprot:CCA26429.1 AlNc14C373G11137 [Albugo laibachii Nc14]
MLFWDYREYKLFCCTAPHHEIQANRYKFTTMDFIAKLYTGATKTGYRRIILPYNNNIEADFKEIEDKIQSMHRCVKYIVTYTRHRRTECIDLLRTKVADPFAVSYCLPGSFSLQIYTSHDKVFELDSRHCSFELIKTIHVEDVAPESIAGDAPPTNDVFVVNYTPDAIKAEECLQCIHIFGFQKLCIGFGFAI